MEQQKLIELIQRSRNGDHQAQEELVETVQNRVYYHCKKMLKHEEDALDATQDVLITMLTSLDKLRDPAAFFGWVNGITANRCKNLLSHRPQEWQIPEDGDGNSLLDTLENLDDQTVPDKALDNEETSRLILGLIDALPYEQRECVLFYYYDEMSVREIAEIMGVSEGTIKSRLNYARKSIKKGVEKLERQGTKLYSVSLLPFLAYFLRRNAQAEGLDAAMGCSLTQSVLNTARAAVAGTAAGTAAGTSAAGTGAHLLGGISVKVIAGIAAAVLVVGGAVVGISALVQQKDEPELVSSSFWEDIGAGIANMMDENSGALLTEEDTEDGGGLLPEDPGPVNSPYQTTTTYDPDTYIQRTTMDTGIPNLEIYYEIPVFPETTEGRRVINTFYREQRDAFFQSGSIEPILQDVRQNGAGTAEYRYVTDATISWAGDQFVNVVQTLTQSIPIRIDEYSDGAIYRTSDGAEVTVLEVLDCTQEEFMSMLRDALQSEGILNAVSLTNDVAQYPISFQDGDIYVGVSVPSYRGVYYVRLETSRLPDGGGEANPVSAADGRVNLLNSIAYYGDASKCAMTAEQALAFAQVIEDETAKLEGQLRGSWHQEEGEVYAYAALVDAGDGIPVLFFGGGAVWHYTWGDWTQNIREDGCTWSDTATVGVWQFSGGQAAAFLPLIADTTGQNPIYDAGWVDEGLFLGSGGFDERIGADVYHGEIYPASGGTISSSGTQVTSRMAQDAPVGHQADGGTGGRIWGMASAADTVAALRAWVELD